VSGFRAWLTLILVSALFFLITAASFGSLGLVLPAMVAELHWSWGEAGTGFSLLGVFCGVTSTIPAFLVRRVGVRWTLTLGGVILALSFICLARTHGLPFYFVGASLMGLGFTLLATVPGTYLLARCFARPSFAFGLYFTLGGLGGVAGPLLYLWLSDVAGDWRVYWLAMGAAVLVTALAAAMLVDVHTDVAAGEPDRAITSQAWDVKAALRTPQFAILAAAYSAFLFVGITANSVSVAHLTQHGVAAAVAGGMMSIEALFNSGARLFGGLAQKYVNARLLLALALACLIGGLLALSAARDTPMMLAYAAGIGIGYGLTFFASTILLLDYFGRGPYLELFSIVNLVSTIGSVAPALAGFTRDGTGSFTPFFLVLSVAVLGVLVAVLWMRAPRKGAA
jgi:MFS family permease